MHGSSASGKPRILLVEHEPAACEQVARALSDEYVVDTANNGHEALRAVLEALPVLVVTDIVMPELDGIELLKALRSARRTETVPVLLVSGNAREEQRIEGFKQDADGYLAKPYTVSELRARIGSILRVARSRHKAARAEAERRVLEERAELLENLTDGFYALDREFRFTYVNQRALDHLDRTREALLGKVLWDVFPVARGTIFQQEYERALREQCSVAFEVHSLISGIWVDVRAYPTPHGLAVYFRDTTERRQAEDQLRQADSRKTEFLAILAHELRNPLAPLRNGLQILKLRGDEDPAVRSQTISMMDRQLAHLVRLVDDLLDVSRVARGRFELRRQKVLLTEVLENAVEASRALIESHRHDLVLDLRQQGLVVDGDPDRLAQVFSNLLVNSAKYTKDGGRIALALERENEWARVTVQDNGIGIAAADLEDIFEMFSQARAHAADATGLGIGLSLVRQLVRMHGGTVHAYSAGPGQGSTFTVRLPTEAGDPAVLEAPLCTEGRIAGSRILIVDDNADAAASLATLLELQGHEVRTAADGVLAVEQAQVFAPDIIFMDLAMPRLDGFEAARRIRASALGERVRIVALTGWGQDADRRRTCEAGIEHHLTKPVSLAALQSLFETLARG